MKIGTIVGATSGEGEGEEEEENTYDYYYNRQWQVLEIRKNADVDPEKQYVYHPQYVDSIALRDYDANLDGTSVRHYYLQDANFNVTAITDATGTIVERYSYTPYGEVTIMDASYTTRASSLVANELLFTGRRTDPETGLQLNRNRFCDPQMGRWVTQDPIGYDAGSYNMYEYIASQPTYWVDPSGLHGIYDPGTGDLGPAPPGQGPVPPYPVWPPPKPPEPDPEPSPDWWMDDPGLGPSWSPFDCLAGMGSGILRKCCPKPRFGGGGNNGPDPGPFDDYYGGGPGHKPPVPQGGPGNMGTNPQWGPPNRWK